MKLLAINGSPRKKWNTATILESVLAGAKEAMPGLEGELIHLYEHDYKGRVSCFECKRIGGKSYGKCAVKDGISEVLEKSLHADCLVFGTPIYFSDVTGMMRCYWERLFFPVLVYDKNYSSLAPQKVRTGFVYTMNAPEGMLEDIHYPERLKVMEDIAARMLGHAPLMEYVCDTWQFKEYAKYKSDAFSPEAKAKVREAQFPIDREKARAMGRALALGQAH
ncbi:MULTISPECIES: flavodoxin family protein [unclassified Desulfovibrio]|uniref:flavodoxin family protein n=1 Tax=unclassified Desulfovibrio TaxID=2593640 RepID=UPI0013EBA65C|nr:MULTISPECIES: flavodoxin family protein [unclassified Desulfovibrio]